MTIDGSMERSGVPKLGEPIVVAMVRAAAGFGPHDSQRNALGEDDEVDARVRRKPDAHGRLNGRLVVFVGKGFVWGRNRGVPALNGNGVFDMAPALLIASDRDRNGAVGIVDNEDFGGSPFCRRFGFGRVRTGYRECQANKCGSEVEIH